MSGSRERERQRERERREERGETERQTERERRDQCHHICCCEAQLRSFAKTLEGCAFLMCELCKCVRFMITEAAMYRRGFIWSKEEGDL